MQGITVDFHPPTGLLEIIKAFLDLFTVVGFFIVLIVIIKSSKKYPMIARKKTFWPLVTFSILGIISSSMDAFDEWFWFSPGEFYDFIWKPLRLGFLLVAVFILIFAFSQFYDFSKRLFGEEIDE